MPASSMQTLLLTGPGQFRLTSAPTPTPGRDEVLIRVEACGICGSDVHGYDGSTGRRIPPIVMGHEAAGILAAVGEDVSDFGIGERVTFDSTISCGACPYCLRGETNLCERREIVGVSCDEFRRAGAFADYIVVPRRILYRLPASLPFAEAAMLEAISVALHAVQMGGPAENGSALVIGAGMIGLLTLQAAKAAGYESVTVVDTDASRLKLALEMGADAILVSSPALADEISRATGGRGMDTVFEAVGAAVTVSAAIDCVRKGGTVVLVGNVAPEVTLPLQKVVSRQIRLQGSAASAGEYPQAMELLASGAMRVQPLISAVAPLAEGPVWFERLHAGEPGLMKVVLSPTMDAGEPAQ